jgi:hypothetical protein
MWTRTYVNGPDLASWGLIGVVPSEATSVKVTFDNGSLFDLELFELLPELGAFKVFSGESSEGAGGYEIVAKDSIGSVIATERRPEPSLRTASP